MKWSSELKLEREQLEHRVKQLSNSITVRNWLHFTSCSGSWKTQRVRVQAEVLRSRTGGAQPNISVSGCGLNLVSRLILSFLFHQKCMETKNTILARQKEMQLSLEKVKHLIRLIQAFNFNQALAETEAKDVSARVQDGAEGAVGSEAAPEANSEDKAKAGKSSASSSADGNDQQEEHGAAGNSQAVGAAAGDADGQPVRDESAAPAAENSPGSGAGGKAELGVGAGGGGDTGPGLQAGRAAEPETEAAPAGDIPASSAVTTVATTNGTAEPACPDHSPAGGCTTNSESKMAAVNPPETAAEKKQEDITDNDGSNSNSKTSEPSQHSLPALVSSLDNKK